ncbi:MAG: hypothetical protein GY864_09405 [Desulfobacterales bacterium]|nr:hypothetical protein [Desulfobacterales bacterium]
MPNDAIKKAYNGIKAFSDHAIFDCRIKAGYRQDTNEIKDIIFLGLSKSRCRV